MVIDEAGNIGGVKDGFWTKYENVYFEKELKLKLWDYVHWYNHHRIHSSLGYQTPVQYRQNNLKKVV